MAPISKNKTRWEHDAKIHFKLSGNECGYDSGGPTDLPAGKCEYGNEPSKALAASNLMVRYQSFIYSPTDAQVSCLKKNIKICIKIYIKTAPTCFSAVTPSSGSVLFVLAKVTVVKIAN
jgi:hypothetical protein